MFDRDVKRDPTSPYECDCGHITTLTKQFRNHLRFCKAVGKRVEEIARQAVELRAAIEGMFNCFKGLIDAEPQSLDSVIDTPAREQSLSPAPIVTTPILNRKRRWVPTSDGASSSHSVDFASPSPLVKRIRIEPPQPIPPKQRQLAQLKERRQALQQRREVPLPVPSQLAVSSSPLHWSSSPPAPERSRARTFIDDLAVHSGDESRDEQSGEEDQDDEYDLDDPFIDDVESEASKEEWVDMDEAKADNDWDNQLGEGEAPLCQLAVEVERPTSPWVMSSPARQAKLELTFGIVPEEQEQLKLEAFNAGICPAGEEVPMTRLDVSTEWLSEFVYASNGYQSVSLTDTGFVYSSAPL